MLEAWKALVVDVIMDDLIHDTTCYEPLACSQPSISRKLTKDVVTVAALRKKGVRVSYTDEFSKLHHAHHASQTWRELLLDVDELEDRTVTSGLKAGHVVSRDLRLKCAVSLMDLSQLCCWVERHRFVSSHNIVTRMWVHHRDSVEQNVSQGLALDLLQVELGVGSHGQRSSSKN